MGRHGEQAVKEPKAPPSCKTSITRFPIYLPVGTRLSRKSLEQQFCQSRPTETSCAFSLRANHEISLSHKRPTLTLHLWTPTAVSQLSCTPWAEPTRHQGVPSTIATASGADVKTRGVDGSAAPQLRAGLGGSPECLAGVPGAAWGLERCREHRATAVAAWLQRMGWELEPYPMESWTAGCPD